MLNIYVLQIQAIKKQYQVMYLVSYNRLFFPSCGEKNKKSWYWRSETGDSCDLLTDTLSSKRG